MVTKSFPLLILILQYIFITDSIDNNTIISEWTSVEIIDLNLQKSKAIYSRVTTNEASGVWILGGIINDGITISNSISFLNFATDDTTIYDDFLNKDSNILPYPIYCSHQCSTTINHQDIVIVSPYTINDDIIYDLWIFHSSQIALTTNVSMDVEAANPCITSSISDSLVYIIGGMDRNGNILNILQIFDVNTKQWIQINGTMNIGRMSASCNIYDNKLYVFGGTINNDTDTNIIEYYDIDNDEWTLISINDTSLSVKTHNHHSILIDNIIFNVGGYHIDSYIVDAFRINGDDDFEVFAQEMTNITHLYGICSIDSVDKRFFIISGENGINGEILNRMEYSNKLEDVIFSDYYFESEDPTSSPTTAPTDIYDQIEDKIMNILDSSLLDPTTWSTLTLIVVIIILSLIFVSCLAFCQQKCCFNCCGNRGADDVEWWRLFRYSLQVYDLFTDINFCYILWLGWNEWNKTDNIQQTTYHLYAAILCSIFLFIPYISNLLFVLCSCGLPSLLPHEAKLWMIANNKLFAILVCCSGGVYASLTLVNSKMFGISLFMMGLSRRQLLQFTDIQVKLSILLENIPQLALQLSVILNRYLHKNIYHGIVIDLVTGMSLISSSFLIIIGLISTCIIKAQIIDDLEIIIDVTSVDLEDKKIIRKIHSCLGLRHSISKELSLVFGVNPNVIEVPMINRTMYGCKIRLYIAKTDTLKNINDLKIKINDIKKVLSSLFRINNANKIHVSITTNLSQSDIICNVDNVLGVTTSNDNTSTNQSALNQIKS